MRGEQYHYFIEFRPQASDQLPRQVRQESSRQTAEDFVQTLKVLLSKKNLEHKMSFLNITLFGQVLIACERDVISLIHRQNDSRIAVIRQSNLEEGFVSRLTARPPLLERRQSA